MAKRKWSKVQVGLALAVFGGIRLNSCAAIALPPSVATVTTANHTEARSGRGNRRPAGWDVSFQLADGEEGQGFFPDADPALAKLRPGNQVSVRATRCLFTRGICSVTAD